MPNLEDSQPQPIAVHRAGRVEKGVVVAFLALNVILPVAFQDLYPFTIGPMFRDHPQAYCNYQVFAADGSELPVEDFQLQRHYDGNPPGLGTGIVAPPTFNTFGVVHDTEKLRRHVLSILKSAQNHDEVVVVQEVIGAVDSHKVGVADRTELRIHRHEQLVQ